MKVTMLLADSAQEVNGKLYVLGGGWSTISPVGPMAVGPMAVGVVIAVPWTAANQKHNFELALLSEDGQPPPMQLPDGAGSVGEAAVGGTFEVGRPPGTAPGSELNATFAVQLGPLPLIPGQGYVWRLTIDGATEEHWQLPFRVRSVS